MKIALTGHTSGIGKALYDILSQEHEVVCFSRSNGYDIKYDITIEKIVQGSLDCDVFINNAYYSLAQVNILNRLWKFWARDKSKTIVNISSLSKYPGISGNASGYSAHKAALSHQAFLLMFKGNRKCRMINVNPGYVESKMTEGVDANMLTAPECAEQIAHAINLPQHIEIGELSLWRPY
jgi:NAD(P)-dependent dehydrogenase (short-subunit alcohol dehydrogenase family)|tara:strand:- start:8271 stop:8810 length:540 start_codon:yes stop_codon:yes gene_type:complete